MKKKYIYAPRLRSGQAFGLCVAYFDGAVKYYLHHDATGSVRQITDFEAILLNEYRYYPFGDSLYASCTVNNDLKFTGKPYVAGAELYDFSARYYDPEIGRFYSMDPLGGGGGSPYAYCYNSPLIFGDPSGMEADPWRNLDDWHRQDALQHGPGHFEGDPTTDCEHINFASWPGTMQSFLYAHKWLYNDILGNLCFPYRKTSYAGSAGSVDPQSGNISIMDQFNVTEYNPVSRSFETSSDQQYTYTNAFTASSTAGPGAPTGMAADLAAEFWKQQMDLPFTKEGEAATLWYAEQYNQTGNGWYYAGGLTSSLWMPNTALATISTLTWPAGIGDYMNGYKYKIGPSMGHEGGAHKNPHFQYTRYKPGGPKGNDFRFRIPWWYQKMR